MKLVRWNQIPGPKTHKWMARVEVGAQGGQGGRVGTVLKWRMYGQGKIGLFPSSSEAHTVSSIQDSKDILVE